MLLSPRLQRKESKLANIHITEINGEKFVLGLFWQSITPGKDNRKQARKLGEELSKDLLIIRNGENLQAGYCSRADGCKDGYLSLAAAITKGASEIGINGSWLGVFKLPDGTYAFIATNEGMFLPEGDFGGTFEEVKDRLLKAYSYGLQWTHIIAPDEFRSSLGIGLCEFKSIDEFLPKKNGKIKIHKWWALESTKPGFPAAKLLGALCLSGLVGGGYFVYTKYEEKKEAEEYANKLKITQEIFSRKINVEHLPHPWATQISSKDFLNHCLNNIENKYIAPGLWKLERITCVPGSIEYAWDRGKSNINKLMLYLPTATIDASGDKANINIPLVMDGNKHDEVISDLVVARSNFLSFFQARGLSVKLTEQPVPPVPPPVAGEPVTPAPVRDWRTYDFQFQIPFNPSKFIDVLEYPVTRINKIELKLSGKESKPQWIVDGVMYTKQ